MRRNVLTVLVALVAFGAGVLAAQRAAPLRPLDAGTDGVVGRAPRVEVHASDIARALSGGPAGASPPAQAEGIARTWYLARLAEVVKPAGHSPCLH